MLSLKRHFKENLSDGLCIASIIGIWPRFIEPNLLCTTHLELKIDKLPASLDGLKILHFSDLHLHPQVTDRFIKKMINKIKNLQPDLIVFTGDFLCCSILHDPERLKDLLCNLNAPFGCYAVLGNHDYSEFVSINDQGDYDVIQKSSTSMVSKGIGRLVQTIVPSGLSTEQAKEVAHHQDLISLLQKTPFQLLDNVTRTLPIKDSFLNLTGLGEHMLGKADIQKAFESYKQNYPGIILVHNPDAISKVKSFPGDVILCGHTHGGEIYLPWLWKKFTLMENPQFKRGLKRYSDKWLYTNRGVGGSEIFRLFSPPELLLLTLRQKNA